MSAATDSLRYERCDATALITFNRPAVRNAFTLAMFDQLAALIDAAAHDATVRVIVLTGAGGAFSAGIDLAEQERLLTDLSIRTARQHLTQMQAVTRQLLALPKPVIAAINGVAVGVGAELAIASDIRLAAEGALFQFAEVRRGLFETNGVMYLLPRIVGHGRALEWLLTGDKIPAPSALAAGLVTHIESEETLLSFALEMAARLAVNAPISMRLVKQVMTRTYDLDRDSVMQLEVDGMLECLGSDDLREGLRAFAEKRTPEYCGR